MLHFTPLLNQQNMFLYVPKGVRIKQSPLKDFVFQRTLFDSSGTNIYCWLRLFVTFHYFPKNRETLYMQSALQPFLILFLPPFLSLAQYPIILYPPLRHPLTSEARYYLSAKVAVSLMFPTSPGTDVYD